MDCYAKNSASILSPNRRPFIQEAINTRPAKRTDINNDIQTKSQHLLCNHSMYQRCLNLKVLLWESSLSPIILKKNNVYTEILQMKTKLIHKLPLCFCLLHFTHESR